MKPYSYDCCPALVRNANVFGFKDEICRHSQFGSAPCIFEVCGWVRTAFVGFVSTRRSHTVSATAWTDHLSAREPQNLS